MIDTEKYQPARQNMKFVTDSLRSLATKLHILARQADIFRYQSIHIQITYTYRYSDDESDQSNITGMIQHRKKYIKNIDLKKTKAKAFNLK